MHELALSPDVAQVPKDTGDPSAAELTAGRRTVNEVTIQLSSHSDHFVVLSGTVLEKLKMLTLDHLKIAFRETGREGVEVLSRVNAQRARYGKWQPVISKELFRTYRITTGNHVEVVHA